MESLKRRPAEKEKTTRSEKINVTFNVIIGLVILLGSYFYPLQSVRRILRWKWYLQSGSRSYPSLLWF